MKKNKWILKVIAGVIALGLIGGILFVTNSFVGNPISAMLANRAIEKYVEENYPSLNLEIEKASYNFKDGSYVAKAKSETSIDTKFSVYYRNGKVLRDDYEGYVLGGFNTLQRLENEYSAIAKAIVKKELGYDNTTMVMYDKEVYENLNSLELDTKFDRSLPLEAEVNIRMDLKDSSFEGIAEVLTDAHQAFIANDCSFKKYGLYAENDGMMVMINEVTPADIESGELITRLQRAAAKETASGISVFIKGEKK